ncbi:MAG: Zn-ribbon domain-containing OB-fold protein [Thermoplasmata archaeon]|nr:Zn-ribbon domain-containing OB-fold protein [Thermoplasmata archaeon]
MPVPRYWRYQDQRYNLAGSKCGVCGGVYFPQRPLCPKCHRESLGKMERVTLSGEGRIISYTVVHEPLIDYEHQAPYIMALIETPEGPILLGQIVDAVPEEVEIGREVEAVFRKLREEGKSGTIQYGYKFRLKR